MSGNAYSAGQSEPANSIRTQNSRHHDRIKTLSDRTQLPRAKSTCLLKQIISTNYEIDRYIDFSPKFFDSLSLPDTINAEPDQEQKSNSTSKEVYFTTKNVAESSLDTDTDVRTKKTVASDVMSTRNEKKGRNIVESSRINTHGNSSGKRNRGVSLERTRRERVINEILSKSNYLGPQVISNDVLVFPHEPLTVQTNVESHPIESIRTKYNSWRRNQLKTPMEKAWSLEEIGSGETCSGNVEKSVKESLNGIELISRSRKTSHSLGFFKEGLTPDDSRLKEIKSRGYLKESDSSSRAIIPRHNDRFQPKLSNDLMELRSRNFASSSSSEAAIVNPQRLVSTASSNLGEMVDTKFANSSHYNETSDKQKFELTTENIDTIARAYHQMNSHSFKGKLLLQDPSALETGQNEKIESDYSLQKKSNLSKFKKKKKKIVTCSRSSTDEDDSGEEKISSALFLPHQVAPKVNERPRARLHSGMNSSHQEASYSEEWLEEHIPSHDKTENYTLQNNTSRSPFESVETARKTSIDGCNKLRKTHPIIDLDIDSHTEQSFENSPTSQAQDDKSTPTGSPKLLFSDLEETSKSSADPQTVTKKPLEAIELIPYSHQVGGHTTLWRFSRRAVCKQLNNRENEFYERIEQNYPQLLRFLPRYIGVLNVKFEKQNRNKHSKKEIQEPQPETLNLVQENPVQVASRQASCPTLRKENLSENREPYHRRVISNSSTPIRPQPVPTVTFADNRHIIPTSILKPQPTYDQNQNGSHNDIISLNGAFKNKTNECTVNMGLSRSSREANPWGKSYVNKVLREDVFREVFLQKPIAIRHKKSAIQRTFPYRNTNHLRNSNSESNLQTADQGEPFSKSPLQSNAIASKGHQSTEEPTTNSHFSNSGNSSCISGNEVNIGERTKSSSPNPDTANSGFYSGSKRQRRYSSGGLRRRPAEVADDRGNLKYFEEADETIQESSSDNVFSVNSENTNIKNFFPRTRSIQDTNNVKLLLDEPSRCVDSSSDSSSKSQENPSTLLEVPRPVNPKEARAQPGSRVEYFLLLEDLTAGMKRPCIMDLKMGTRQHGVDSDPQKQESQREKCAATTSQKLGVRVCGLQVWDVYLQDYIFEDKYYGRSLKAGKEFRDALTRFLYNGIDYSSVLRHIPSILQKLSELEVLIKKLNGYRFYGTSLLIFYDGATEECSSDSTANGKDDSKIIGDIDFKIADFANCVTREDLVRKRSCPPKHPKVPDLGFLRGLKTLKRYFLRIEQDLHKKRELVNPHNEHDQNFNESDENDDEAYISY